MLLEVFVQTGAFGLWLSLENDGGIFRMPPDRVAGRASSFSPVYRTKLTPQTCKEGQKECMSPPERKRNVMQTAVSARGMWECRTLAEILEVEGIKRYLSSLSFSCFCWLAHLLQRATVLWWRQSKSDSLLCKSN